MEFDRRLAHALQRHSDEVSDSASTGASKAQL